MEEKIIAISPELKEETINLIEQENEKQVLAERENILIGAGGSYVAGDNITIQNNVISVVTTNNVEQDNTKPITSAGVYTTVGNINELLKTI